MSRRKSLVLIYLASSAIICVTIAAMTVDKVIEGRKKEAADAHIEQFINAFNNVVVSRK